MGSPTKKITIGPNQPKPIKTETDRGSKENRCEKPQLQPSPFLLYIAPGLYVAAKVTKYLMTTATKDGTESRAAKFSSLHTWAQRHRDGHLKRLEMNLEGTYSGRQRFERNPRNSYIMK